MSAESVIDVRELRKSYGKTVAVDGVDLTVERGEIFGILGPNGAGKTTTVEIIEGLTKPDGGSVSVLGLDPTRQHKEVTKVLGAQLQESRLPEKLRVREAVKLYASFYRDPVPIDELLERVGLTDKRRAFFGNLSGGQQQRLSVALALVGRPTVAILDEVTAGLDPTARRVMWQSILDLRDSGVTVILVTHFMEEAERLCDRVAVMESGRVVAVGTPAEIVGHSVGGQRVGLTLEGRVPEQELRAIPGVTGVEVDGRRVTVTGTGDLVAGVTATLHEQNVRYSDIQVHQGTLDDAFVRLTGNRSASMDEEAP